jgi:glycosyltransferase involved in cell wall biosynthesis
LAPQAATKTAVIYNGVVMENFRADADTGRAVKQSFGWTETTRVVGTVSRLSPEKNVALFLTAAVNIAREIPDVKFLVVGDGPERAALQARFQKESIVFAGQRADVPRLLQAMDVFVLSSDAEGFPVAIVEAMAAARAIVATHVGGVREALADGACGRVIPPRDVEALTTAILKLLRDENERRALGERAHAYAAQHFTRAQQAHAMQRVLERARVISQ